MDAAKRALATTTLRRQVEYFRSIQDRLAREHYGRVVLIHDEAVDSFHDTEIDAFAAGKKKYEPGSFLIQKCIPASEEITPRFHSRVRL